MVVKLTLYFILLSLIFTSCNYHSDFEYDNFLSACKNGDLEKVKIFVEKGLDVNYKRCKGHGMKAKYCESPLKISVYHENIELCEFLISNNADPNQTNKIVIEGYSYLKSALNIIKGKRHNIKNINKNPNEMEKQLLLYFMNDGNASLNTDNINPNVIDENGKHLIEYVIEDQYFIILPSLFIEGADPNYTTYNNYTLLNLLEDKYEIYKILYELHEN